MQRLCASCCKPRIEVMLYFKMGENNGIILLLKKVCGLTKIKGTSTKGIRDDVDLLGTSLHE